tara:strand:+ start:815 stop:1510 length:696 start_codon:yes stop_codon:yes gene_type:complete
MTNELRTCENCSIQYEHEPLMAFGSDIIAHINVCLVCSSVMEDQQNKKKREDDAKTKWETTVPDEYRNTKEDHSDFPNSVLGDCLKMIKSNENPFIGLIGRSGIGKTRVAAMIIKRLIWRGDFATWINSSTFQWACQNQFNDGNSKEAQSLLKSCRESKNLVFDDIGSLKSTETVSDNLYSVLEHRTTTGQRMIWTSNETLDEILAGKGLSEKARARSISRLGGYSNIIEL